MDIPDFVKNLPGPILDYLELHWSRGPVAFALACNECDVDINQRKELDKYLDECNNPKWIEKDPSQKDKS